MQQETETVSWRFSLCVEANGILAVFGQLLQQDGQAQIVCVLSYCYFTPSLPQGQTVLILFHHAKKGFQK